VAFFAVAFFAVAFFAVAFFAGTIYLPLMASALPHYMRQGLIGARVPTDGRLVSASSVTPFPVGGWTMTGPACEGILSSPCAWSAQPVHEYPVEEPRIFEQIRLERPLECCSHCGEVNRFSKTDYIFRSTDDRPHPLSNGQGTTMRACQPTRN
jgi:hypothetical protein